METLTPQTPTSTQQNQEETFLQKNKTMIFGGVITLIVLTVVVGIGLSIKNTNKLEGMIMKVQEQTTNSSANASEEINKIPRK